MGHRINPIGLRLNIMQHWNTVAPSKSVYVKDFFFSHFFYLELYNFFIKTDKDLLTKQNVYSVSRKLTKYVRKQLVSTKKLNENTDFMLYRLFIYKRLKTNKKEVKLLEQKLFFHIHKIFVNLKRNQLIIDYCFFQKIMGNLNLKFFCKLNYFESIFFNAIRFSQKWLKIKFFSLLFFKSEKFNKQLKYDKNRAYFLDLYVPLYQYDFNHKKNEIFTFSKNFSPKFFNIYSIFLNISKLFIVYYLNNFNFFFNYMRKFLFTDLKKLKKYKNINIEFLFNLSLSSNIFSKNFKFKLSKYKSGAKVITTFFRKILKAIRRVRKLQIALVYSNFFLNYKNEKFYLMDNANNFNKLIDIFGVNAKMSGRFTKKRRVKSRNFFKGSVALNSFHKNIDLTMSEIRLKYGISSVKLWVYKAPDYKYFT